MVKLLKLSVAGWKYKLLERLSSPKICENRLELFLSASTSHDERISVADAYFEDTFFFDRSASVFISVLEFTLNPQTGLHAPSSVCKEQFLLELAFWNLGPHQVASCCSTRLDLEEKSPQKFAFAAVDSVDDPCPKQPAEVAATQDPLIDGSFTSDKDQFPAKDEFSEVCLGDFRRTLWNTVEDPGYSKAAKVFGGVSIFFIVLSVLIMIIASLPDCQYENGNPHVVLEITEYICIGWFTLEYLGRLTLAANKCQFVRSPMEVIDLLSIFPFYLELLFLVAGVHFRDMDNLRGALLVMRLLRVLRVARIFKLARYSVAMKSCGRTLRESRREVGMLVVFVSIMIVLFSTTVYFMEKDHPGTKFTSVPTSFWWCVVTITTVGYGDMTPQTTGGRLMASVASVAGVVVLAFPITVIVENFYRFYRKEKQEACEHNNMVKDLGVRSRFERHNLA